MSAFVCGSIGVVIGSICDYSKKEKESNLMVGQIFQLFLLWLSIIWINRGGSWDRLTMVIGNVSVIVVSLWPMLTQGQLSGFTSLWTIMLLLGAPFAISVITLIVPFPSFAISKSVPTGSFSTLFFL
jgi:hypothetical protein